MDHNPGERRIGRIPVRNLWLLMLYASALSRTRELSNVLTDDAIDDVPDLIARLLATSVERRFRRNLTRGYLHRQEITTRVRGRIDILATEAQLLLSRGEVFCRFEELAIDTPRNRLVRAALERVARLVRDSEVAQQCRSLAATLARAGVSGIRPSRADLAREQIGRNDAADRNMIALAELAFDLALPTEDSGLTALAAPDREEAWVRLLFEKAVLGFSQFELESLGWYVRGGVSLHWQVASSSEGLGDILPRMVTDIILDEPINGERIVIDTKFTSIFTTGRFGDATLKSGYLYQMYAYLRSQEGIAPWDNASGLFLHPAIGRSVREQAVVQNHLIKFVTVDLSRSPSAIRCELKEILLGVQRTIEQLREGNLNLCEQV